MFVDVFKVMLNDLTIDLYIHNEYEAVCNKFDLNLQIIMVKNYFLFD